MVRAYILSLMLPPLLPQHQQHSLLSGGFVYDVHDGVLTAYIQRREYTLYKDMIGCGSVWYNTQQLLFVYTQYTRFGREATIILYSTFYNIIYTEQFIENYTVPLASAYNKSTSRVGVFSMHFFCSHTHTHTAEREPEEIPVVCTMIVRSF